MGYFEQIEQVGDNAARLNFAKAYIGRIYGINPETFVVPQQGEQLYTVISGDKVFRVPRGPGVGPLMANEVNVLRALAGKTSLPIPPVIDFQPERHIMCIGKLPGQALLREDLLAVAPEEQRSIARRVGLFLAEMHELLPQSSLDETPWPRAEVIRKAETLLQNENDSEKRLRLRKVLSFCHTETLGEPCVMIHGDMHSGNFLYDKAQDYLGMALLNKLAAM